MKKLLLLLIFITQQACYCSQSHQNNQKWQKMAQNLTTQVAQKNNHTKLIAQCKDRNFSQHLIVHFGIDAVENFIIAGNYLPKDIFEQAEIIIYQASERFHNSQSFPTVNPAGKTLPEYIDSLNGVHD